MKTIFLFCCMFSMPLVAGMKVTALSGSLRKDSYNKQLVKQVAQMAQQMGASVTVVDLKEYPMPFYDGDLEASIGMPDTAKKLRQILIESDAIIISTPEYNGSISAVLKNAIDWASRSEEGEFSNEAFKGKKFALFSASPGKMGGVVALNHLRSILERLDGVVVEQQVSIGHASAYFKEKDASKASVLKEAIQELVAKK